MVCPIVSDLIEFEKNSNGSLLVSYNSEICLSISSVKTGFPVWCSFKYSDWNCFPNTFFLDYVIRDQFVDRSILTSCLLDNPKPVCAHPNATYPFYVTVLGMSLNSVRYFNFNHMN